MADSVTSPSVAIPGRQPTRAGAASDALRAFWSALVPRRYAGCTFDNFELDTHVCRGRIVDASPSAARNADGQPLTQKIRVVEALRKFCQESKSVMARGRNLVLFGPPGTGKDHLLAAVLRGFLISGAIEVDRYASGPPSIRWTTGMDMYARVRDSFDSRERGEESEARWWIAPALLAISDPVPPAGRELKPFEVSFLWRVIDGRYRARKPTFVTVNADKGDELAERIGAQVLDRLKDQALVCHCWWDSYRQPDETVYVGQ